MEPVHMHIQRCKFATHAPFAVPIPGTIAYVTLNMTCALFALECICKSITVEIVEVLISSSNFWHFLVGMKKSLGNDKIYLLDF